MSSSLLIILLVIVWLFVLAPMLIRSRSPIRRTGDALAETRTLHVGGSGRLVPRSRRAVQEPVAGVSDEDVFGLPSGLGCTDSDLVDAQEWQLTLEETIRRETAGRRGEAVRRALADREATPTAAEEETSEIPVVADAGSGAESGVQGPRGAGSHVVAAVSEMITIDAEDGQVSGSDETVEAPRRLRPVPAASGAGSHVVAVGTADDSDTVGAEAAQADALDSDDQVADDSSAVPAAPARRTVVVDGEIVEQDEREALGAEDIDREAELAHRARRRRPEPVELTAEDLDFAERRRGRGAYDPVADRAAAEDRFRRRRNTTAALAGITALVVLLALLVTPALWWLAATTAVVLVAYLTYLRRTAVLEENLRRRRIERMRRARLGVESREDAELSVVPPRLRRPGAVVLEIDDEDPVFDTLDAPEVEEGLRPAGPSRPERIANRVPASRRPATGVDSRPARRVAG